LCLKRTSYRDGRTTKLHPDFKNFFDTFLGVPGAPKQKPYLRLFLDEKPSAANLWLNSNVAGSFAPSSLRETLLKVVKTAGRSTFSLRENHWKLARTHLAEDKRIPVVELAAVLYRDYAIESPSPTLRQLVRIFREEFGYQEPTSGPGHKEFDHLFSDASQSNDGHDWFLMLP